METKLIIGLVIIFVVVAVIAASPLIATALFSERDEPLDISDFDNHGHE